MEENKIVEGGLYLFQHHQPGGPVSLVRVIARSTWIGVGNKWYYRKLDGGTDTTTSDFLLEIPQELKPIAKPIKESFHDLEIE